MNRTIARYAFFLTLAGCLFCAPSFANDTNKNNTLPTMIEKVAPAIVNIRAKIKVSDFQTFLKLQHEKQLPNDTSNGEIPDHVTSIASGVIIDAQKGYILTNAHVVHDAEIVVVTLNDGRHYTATVVGLDNPSDIALLKIESKKLTAISLGDSNTLKVGDPAIAIGNPFGIGQTATSGIISGLKRSSLGIESFENFIQTDASINPGNSGGALLNSSGELIGINTAILSPERGGNVGIGLAIPVNMARSVMQQLIAYGNVKRGALGVGVQDITPDLATAFHLNDPKGAMVTEILPHSPAEKAGLMPGDIIIAVNDASIKNANDLVNEISFLRVGSVAHIAIIRDHQSKTLTTAIWDPQKSKETGMQMNPFLYGVGLKDFSLFSPIHGNVAGVLVISVEENSNAWQSDLHPGDIIIAANQKKISTIDELQKTIANAHHSLVLNVLRGPSALFLVITTEGS